MNFSCVDNYVSEKLTPLFDSVLHPRIKFPLRFLETNFVASCLHRHQRNGAWLWAGWLGFDPGWQWGANFCSLLRVHTGPGTHSVSSKMNIDTPDVKKAERRVSYLPLPSAVAVGI